MTAEGWREALLHAYHRYVHYDEDDGLMGIAQQLAEHDQAKQLLRDAGFGHTGLNLLLTVQEALEWIEGGDSPENDDRWLT